MATQQFVDVSANLETIQSRFRLTEQEVDRAFQQARRRANAAGYDRILRQFTRITGEGRQLFVSARRAFTSTRLTGEGKVWAGLNPRVYGGRRHSTTEPGNLPLDEQAILDSDPRRPVPQFRALFPNLPTDFDAEAVQTAMEQVFAAELEMAAVTAVGK